MLHASVETGRDTDACSIAPQIDSECIIDLEHRQPGDNEVRPSNNLKHTEDANALSIYLTYVLQIANFKHEQSACNLDTRLIAIRLL